VIGAIPFIGAAWNGIKIVQRIEKAAKEGQDVLAAYRMMEAKYSEMDDDVKAAWREVREFIDACRDIL